MDPFEQFLKLKPYIEQNEAILKNLYVYIKDPLKLPVLGEGNSHILFRIGQISNFHLATRDTLKDDLPKWALMHCESYIMNAVKFYNQGIKVPSICGGVYVPSPTSKNRHFLIVEDLTAGGKFEISYDENDNDQGDVNGQMVKFDFDDYFSSGKKPNYKYMTLEKMIELRP